MTLKTVRPGTVIAACVLAMAGTAGAQTTANITIDGTFVPPTCAVTIAGGGTLDWGTMTRATVLGYASVWGTARALPPKTSQITVTCPNATIVGMSWADNRAGNRMAVDGNDGVRFGLGNTNAPGQILGNFLIMQSAPTSTTGGAINTVFIQPAGGGAWSSAAPAPANIPMSDYVWPGYVTAFGRTSTSTTAPAPLLGYTVPLTIYPYVSAAIVTAATSTILIDGSATVTLKYF